MVQLKDSEKNVSELKPVIPNTYRSIFKLFGIPVYSITRTIDEDGLYEKMRDRFSNEIQNQIVMQKYNRVK